MWNSSKFINSAAHYLVNVYLVNAYFCGSGHILQQ